MESLCEFAMEDTSILPLVRVAMIHFQFEAIHPFEDGNGRLGRLIMPLLLGYWGLLERPLLYISEFFERHRSENLRMINEVSRSGAWSAWIAFVLTGIEQQSPDAASRGTAHLSLSDEWKRHYSGPRWTNLPRIIDLLVSRAALTANQVVSETGLSPAAARNNLDVLIEDGILHALPGKERYRVFVAQGILDILLDGPEAVGT